MAGLGWDSSGNLVVKLGMEVSVAWAGGRLVRVELNGSGDLKNRGGRGIAMMERHKGGIQFLFW